jgi:hypothetical protein
LNQRRLLIALTGIIILILGFLTYPQTSADDASFLSIGAIVLGVVLLLLAFIAVIRKRGA